MPQTLAPTIATYIAASNARDADTLIACFTSEAVVVDEARTHRGAAEIRQWFAQTVVAYSFTLVALHVTEQERETVVTCRVSGTFPGSPVDLRFCFNLEVDRIAELTIRS